ncbi:tigger transposable element-derived protein 4 [Elysia marginata]|uniref:Tigger transposable element-derived protein 4 n=1 Tax=Elysia marginata TaxID=1093978 RepID=A0AAV4HQG4_9GAST|nr:tigger transposable element-derived protein 4 [Elysia marginata]
MSAQGKSQRQIADHFRVGKTQVQKTLKRKAEIQAELEAGAPLSKRKNSKPTGNEQINELVHKWFVDATRRRINVTGPMMQEKALQFATELGITTFVASNGWLQSFVKRNNLAFGKLCGESGDVDGFSPSNDVTADEEIDIPGELNTLSLTIVDVNFAELRTIDADINICNTEEVDWSKSATDLLIALKKTKTARKKTKQNGKKTASESLCKKHSLVFTNAETFSNKVVTQPLYNT